MKAHVLSGNSIVRLINQCKLSDTVHDINTKCDQLLARHVPKNEEPGQTMSEKLQQEVHASQLQIVNLECERTTHASIIKELRAKQVVDSQTISCLERENQALRARLEHKESDILQLTKQAGTLEVLRQTLSEQNGTLAKLRALIVRKEEAVQTYKQQCVHVESNCTRLQAASASLQSSLDRTKQDLQIAVGNALRLQEQHKYSMQECARLQATVSKLQHHKTQEVRGLQECVQTLTATNKELHAKQQRLVEQMVRQQEQCTVHTREHQQLQEAQVELERAHAATLRTNRELEQVRDGIHKVLPGSLLSDLVHLKTDRKLAIDTLMQQVSKATTSSIELGDRQEVWDLIALHAMFPFLRLEDRHSKSHSGDLLLTIEEQDVRMSVLIDSKASQTTGRVVKSQIQKLDDDRASVTNETGDLIQYGVMLISPSKPVPRNCLMPDPDAHFWVHPELPRICMVKRDSGQAILHAVMYAMVRTAHEVGRVDGARAEQDRVQQLVHEVETLSRQKHATFQRLDRFAHSERKMYKNETQDTRENMMRSNLHIKKHDAKTVGSRKRQRGSQP